MGRFKVYIMPFDDEGNYTEFVDVTKYVERDGLGTTDQSIDNSDFQLGVFRVSNLSLKLNNRSGLFSDVGAPESIFRFTRADSRIKVTYCPYEHKAVCGFAACGVPGSASLWEETFVFEGLLADDNLVMQIKADTVAFSVLGKESVLSRAIVPFGELADGDTVSEVIFKCLNQSAVTELLVVDSANITPGLDQALDAVACFENKTLREALDQLLLASNSILCVEDDVIYVKGRTATDGVRQIFYGQASSLGAENIQDLKDIKNGLSRTFNFMSWQDGPVVMNTDSALRWRSRKGKELDFEFFTNAIKQQNILSALVEEFAWPKMEFTIIVPITPALLSLKLLDRVVIDYPIVYVPGEQEVPISGTAEWGKAVLPDAQWSISFDATQPFKIISRKVSLSALTVEFGLREI